MRTVLGRTAGRASLILVTGGDGGQRGAPRRTRCRRRPGATSHRSAHHRHRLQRPDRHRREVREGRGWHGAPGPLRAAREGVAPSDGALGQFPRRRRVRPLVPSRVPARGGDRPADHAAAGRGRPDELHRPGQGDRAVGLGGAPAGAPAGEARRHPGLRRRSSTPTRSGCRSPRSCPSSRSTRPPPTTPPTGWPICSAIEACHSVAGEESYILKVRVGLADRRWRSCCSRSAPRPTSPPARRSCSSTPYEGRPPAI